jgi:hypothetical protein
MTHQRLLFTKSTKTKPIHTIVYEIDMLRRCAVAVGQREADFRKSGSDADLYAYNLSIEGFLLHLRNLLDFLVTRECRDTDLRIDKPEGWADRPIDVSRYVDLMKLADELNEARSADGDDGKHYPCRDLIAKFLAHPTTLRNEWTLSWPIEEMYSDMKKIVDDFEARFVEKTERLLVGMSESANSTTGFRTLPPMVTEDGK